MAPEIRATVMIAKVEPKSASTKSELESSGDESAKFEKGFPAKAQGSLTAAMLNPYRIQSTAIRAIAPKLIIIMLMTLFALTRPP